MPTPSGVTPLPRTEPTPVRPRVCLLSAETNAISGGHRYHQHLLAAAPAAGFEMEVARPWPRLALPCADVVLIDSLYAWTVAVAVRRPRRPVAVAIAHQHPGGTSGPRWLRALRRRVDLATYRRCDRIVTPGPLLASTLREQHTFQPERIEVIPPGSDLPHGGSVPPLRGERCVGLLNVANWLPNKGIVELLEAVALLPSDDVTLHLVGRTDVDARYGRLVRRRIEQPDLVDRVVVHGSLTADELGPLYAAADVFAFTSRVETYGSAIGEALRAGLPVVGWRNPHLCALVEDEVAGLLVEAARVDQLADAVHRLAVDPIERQRLAAGARRRGTDLPTWRETTTRFFAMVTRLVTEPVEPTQHGTATHDVDASDASVLDEETAGKRTRIAHRPGNGSLDGADVGDDDHD